MEGIEEERLIGSIKRYAELLGWLMGDIWSTCRPQVMAIYGLDVLGMGTMAGAYGMARNILVQLDDSGEVLQMWGREWPVWGAIGAAAGLILMALLVQGTAQLYSRRLALVLVGRYEAVAVGKIWAKMMEKEMGRGGAVEEERRWMRRIMMGQARDLGMCARLAVMAISGAITGLFFGALAVYFTPRTAVVFLVVGLAVFGFLIKNNRRAALVTRRAREMGRQAKDEVKVLFKNYTEGKEEAQVSERLRDLYAGGAASQATAAQSERLFRIYQSQFVMSVGAAFAIALALVIPLLDPARGTAAVPVAMTAAGLVLLKQAFGFAGSVATYLTRLNLKYAVLLEHRRFLLTGRLPKIIPADAEEEEEG